jgi:hypothetical protein
MAIESKGMPEEGHMPYVEKEMMIDSERLEPGTWVPERNWDRWQHRGMAVPGPLLWRHDVPMTSPPGPLPRASLAVLAADIADAQRDAFIYTNFIERLKTEPSDTRADDVVKQMKTLGLRNASWSEDAGGPPPGESPRPFGKVLDWLFRLVAKVSKFLLNCVNFVMTSLSPLGVSAVAVGISLPPSVSFEFPPSLFQNAPAWTRVREFLDGVVRELDQNVFAA